MTMDIYSRKLNEPPNGDRDFLIFLMRGGAVARYHNCATLQKQSVAAHTFGVLWLTWVLSKEAPSQNLLMAAAAHDLAEQWAGDVPAPLKNLGDGAIAHMLDKMETEVLENYGVNFPLTKSEERVLKMADKLEGCLFCIYERMQGNKFVEFTYSKFLKYAKRITLVNFEREARLLRAIEELWAEAIL